LEIMKTALVTGIAGQDGSYLAELLVGKGYRVAGTEAGPVPSDHPNLRAVRDRIEVVEASPADPAAFGRLLRALRPSEVYNLAARSSLADAFADPVGTGESLGLDVARMLETIRSADPSIRFFQAGSREVFGYAAESPQDESTPFRPNNPYAFAKAYAHWITGYYRERHGLFACSAILYNHESPRRRPDFVFRKVTRAAAAISLGRERELRLGDLDARRDWGYAGDFVRAMWLMLQAGSSGDYVLATGETHSVRELCETAFSRVGLDWRDHVRQEAESVVRLPETSLLAGNAGKAKRELGWEPRVPFDELVGMMVEADLASLQIG
jgi:GDPmannose 4,6-dehydratase